MLKVASPIIKGIAEVLKSTGKAGGIVLTVTLAILVIYPKVVAWRKRNRIAALLEAQAIDKVNVATKAASIGFGGWLGIISGGIGLISLLIGAFGKAKDEADDLNDSLDETVRESQGIVGGAASDYTATTETMATKSTSYDMTINATIHGEGDTAISDENAVKVAQITMDEINKGFGDMVK